MSQRFDIIIAGAGMVGTCCALALARRGFKIALIEPGDRLLEIPAGDDEYDLRVSAISPVSQRLLSQLGAWQALNADRVCQYERMDIWHEHGNARIDFDSAELAQSSLGAIVENRQIVAALQLLCQHQPEIQWFMPDRISQLVENSRETIRVKLSSGVELTADLLIAADGRQSSTRTLAGLNATNGRYQQQAIVANIDTELPHRFTAWQRFLSTGPLAYLPLANGQSSIVWSCDDELANELADISDEQFCDRLSQAFEFRLGRVEKVGRRQAFPLGWHYCEQWLKERVVLIGDAAHGVHPLAGQGVNLGFSDVKLMAELLGPLENAWNRKALRRYERQRKSETLLATRAFSGLKMIYGTDNWPVNKLRDVGMHLVQANPAFKRSLIRQAMNNMS